MPCILKVRIIAGRGLPIMDRNSDLTDPYVEIRFGLLDAQRTSIFRKSLNPVWNEDFRLEISDDAMLQDEPLELRVFDYDAIAADDVIGSVMLDLNPLLASGSTSQLAGWFPIFDTIRGMRGELNVQAKLQFFGDANPFKESSAGVRFLCGNGIPSPYPVQCREKAIIYGLVDVIITDVDPDYHWVDSFRTSRSSNEASQRMLQQLSCRLRREMGRRAIEMGGNVVFGFIESFDIEEYTRTITVRGIGTAAFVYDPEEEEAPLNSPGSPTGSVDILTLTNLPSQCIVSIGGVVSARSVKLMSEELKDVNPEENVRDSWLNELREDIRSHARLLNCSAVLNYREEISIRGDVYVLSAEATACKIDLDPLYPNSSASEDEIEDEENAFVGLKKRRICCAIHVPYRRRRAPYAVELSLCRFCNRRYVPELLLATIDPPAEVETSGEPSLVEAYVLKPIKQQRESEAIAASISSALPFVEYDVHRQLLYKLRLKGYNALFGLRYTLSVSNDAILAVASGTAVLLRGLPPPEPLQIMRDLAVRDEEDKWIVDIQRRIVEDAENNHKRVESLLASYPILTEENGDSDDSDDSSLSSSSSTSPSDEEDQQQRLAVVQIDDETDEDLLLVLIEPEFPKSPHFLSGTLASPPDLHIDHKDHVADRKTVPQMVTLFRKARINLDSRHIPFQLARLFHSVYREAHLQAQMSFQEGVILRTIRHQIGLSSDGDIQILLYAMFFGEMQADEGIVGVEREEEWDELISLDVSTSSDESDYEDQQHRIFSRRRKQQEPLEEAEEPEELRNTVTSPGGKIQKFLIAGHMNHVDLSPASSIPASVTSAYYGTISLKFFREVHLAEIPGGSPGATFAHDLLLESLAILRAHAIALGGNAVVNVSLKPSAFLDSYKNQLHGIIHISGDVLEVEPDEPDAWTMLSRRSFYPSIRK